VAALAIIGAATTPEWIGAVFTVVAGVASALWAFSKWLADRADARAQADKLAQDRLRQEQITEQHRREDRAAELVVKLAETTAPEARRWVAGALALYPVETTKLLVHALGHAGDPETASAITLTLASIGADALPEVLHAHRLARTVVAIASSEDGDRGATADVLGADEMLRCTRRVIAHLLLEADADHRAVMDLAGVDLSRTNFAGAALAKVNLRKAVLDGVIFARAKLQEANFRGAVATNAVFSRAHAQGADFTGLAGPLIAIRLSADRATMQDSKLDGSQLDAARFHHASFLRTSLQDASAPGAVFDHATIRRCRWTHVDLRKASARGTTLDGVQLGQATLVDADFRKSCLSKCRLTGTAATGLALAESTVEDCDLGGAVLTRADLRGAVFRRCNLSGVMLDKADLRDAQFSDCKLHRATFTNARFEGTRFSGKNEAQPRTLVLSEGWDVAVFDDAELREAFASASLGLGSQA
jgi:uncharacterized protein YjbI with pentapeptide repeats